MLRRLFYKGLLGLLSLLSWSLAAQSEPGAPDQGARQVQVQTFPDNPEVSETWTVTILVDHPISSEVRVWPPAWAPSFRVEQVRIQSRYIGWSGETAESWTACDLEFTIQEGGMLTLPPIRVDIAGRSIYTQPIRIYAAFKDEMPRTERYRLEWEQVPSVLKTGEEVELTLGIIDRKGPDTQALLGASPQPGNSGRMSYGLAVPENALLEALPLSEADVKGGVFSRYRLIPLSGSQVVIDTVPVPWEGLVLSLPPLSIPILSPQPGDGSISGAPFQKVMGDNEKPLASHVASEVFPWPPPVGAGERFLYALFRSSYDQAEAAVRGLWEQDKQAEALAMLRRIERDSSAGPLFVLRRRAMEEALAIPNTLDEQWRPWRVLLVLFLGISVLLLGVGAFHIFKNISAVTSGPSRSYKNMIPVTIMMVLWGLSINGFAGALMNRRPPGKGSSTVLRIADVYPLPVFSVNQGIEPASQDKAEQNLTGVRFSGGQSGRIRAWTRDWAYIETPDGRAGWVSTDRIIPY